MQLKRAGVLVVVLLALCVCVRGGLGLKLGKFYQPGMRLRSFALTSSIMLFLKKKRISYVAILIGL